MKKRIWISLLIFLVFLITYLVGPVPPNPRYATAWPEVPSDLAELQHYVESTEDTLPVRDDNQARILWHGRSPAVTEYSFVYLHGFGGSYRDGYPLNVNVADTFGANIYLSRWAGHGLKPGAALQSFTPERAWASAREALAIGHRIGRKVIILSTSTGGTLAIKLAATYPDSVHALINISPNIRDDAAGAFLLNSPWGYEIAHLVSLGGYRKIEHQQAVASQYWDTIYPAEALINLQALIGSTMRPTTFEEVTCPVLTLYYYENFLKKDDHVEVDVYPRVHREFATPDSLVQLVPLEEPGTHFIGSAIKSSNYHSAREVIVSFCRQKLGMTLDLSADPEEPL